MQVSYKQSGRLNRRMVIATGALAAGGVRAQASVVLQVAAFPLVDEIARAALPLWNKLHPGVEVKIQTRQYQDHHTAMTTALSTSGNLPDVMVSR